MIEQPVQQLKKKNSLFIIAIILTVVGIIGIVAGMFLFINHDKKESAENGTGNNIENGNNQNSESNDNQNNDFDNNSSSTDDSVEEEYTGTKQNLVIATAGHVDHGKSTLTSAITKLYGEYKTADEIKAASNISKNGVTYRASFVEYETATKHYSQYYMPGYSDYVRSITSGAIKLDGAILVVAATDGPMFQTKANLKLLQQVGVNKIVVYINDSVMIEDKSRISLVREEIKKLIGTYGFDADNTPIIVGSASKAIQGDKDSEESVRNLINAMDRWFTKRVSNETAALHKKFNASVYVLTREENGRQAPFFSNYKPQISISTSIENSTIAFSENIDMVMPGDSVDLTITLENPVLLKKNDYFQVLEDGKLVGVGVVASIEE